MYSYDTLGFFFLLKHEFTMLLLKHEITMVVAGPSNSGKTEFV